MVSVTSCPRPTPEEYAREYLHARFRPEEYAAATAQYAAEIRKVAERHGVDPLALAMRVVMDLHRNRKQKCSKREMLREMMVIAAGADLRDAEAQHQVQRKETP